MVCIAANGANLSRIALHGERKRIQRTAAEIMADEVSLLESLETVARLSKDQGWKFNRPGRVRIESAAGNSRQLVLTTRRVSYAVSTFFKNWNRLF